MASVNHFTAKSTMNLIQCTTKTFLLMEECVGEKPPLLHSNSKVGNPDTATSTKNGLQVRCQLDTDTYPKGIKISDELMANINIERDSFHGEWNYTISPHPLST
jgi:hypothetical protein